MTTSHSGVFGRWRIRLFGERDTVSDQLADIARQGSGVAHLAHMCAFLLVVLFSMGSLVALSGDALTAVLSSWQLHHLDVPDAISIAVSTLLVVAMDVGMLYAASVLRILNARRAEQVEKRVHIAVMVVVALLEAGTYAYMSARYEHPQGAVVWALILARACAAPILAVYLSMARPLPVTPRDILAQVELASGTGVLRDVLMIASDSSAPLARKIELFNASALMRPDDRTRLEHMLAVAQEHIPETRDTSQTAKDTSAYTLSLSAPSKRAGEPPEKPPTGPGSPASRRPPALNRQGTSGKRPRLVRVDATERRVRAALEEDPHLSIRMLAKRARVSESTASKYRRIILAERSAEQVHAL